MSMVRAGRRKVQHLSRGKYPHDVVANENLKKTLEKNKIFLENWMELAKEVGCTEEEMQKLVQSVYIKESSKPERWVWVPFARFYEFCLSTNLFDAAGGSSDAYRIYKKINSKSTKENND